nr:hypothetical protein [Tanacetum cinerariifolium]
MSDDDATRAESPPRGVDSYYRPMNFKDPSPIVYPAAANEAVSNFKIQPNLIAILPVFRGHEEPHAHLREFFSIADTYQVNNTTKDGVRLHLFPFYLKDQAKAWFTSLELGKSIPNVSHVSHNACSMCGDPSHSVNNCQSWGAPSNEEVNGVYGNHPRNDPFSESYNPGWRNHPNFHWKDDDNYNRPNNTQQQNYGYKPRYEGGDSSNFQQNYQQQISYQQRPQQYQNHDQGLSNGQQSNVEQKFDLILSELAKSNQGANLKFESLSKSVVNLERQMGQLAEEVHKREAGKLPSYPTLNPKHKPDGPEHVNMVTSIRYGKTYNNDIKILSIHDFSHNVKDFINDDEIVVEGNKADNVKSDYELVNDLLKDFSKPPTRNPKATKLPKVGEGGVSSTTTAYPAALEKSATARLAKNGPYSEDIWETFKQKRKLKATLPKKIELTEHVNVVLSNSLPPKFKDPGAPLILVVVGNITIKKALLDLDASINILPVSLVDKHIYTPSFKTLDMAALYILDKLSEAAGSAILEDKMKDRWLVAELEALGQRADTLKPLEYMRKIVARDSIRVGVLEQLLT